MTAAIVLVMVEPLLIRQEEPPDDAVIVIRAGVMDSGDLGKSAMQCFERYGLLAISVEAVIDATVDEACRTSPRLGRYRQIRLSSFGRLRKGPFAVVATFEPPHFSVPLPDLSELTLARLDRCFDAPIPNPGLPRPR